jgi:anaerobic ribonucleoside-triphosphate reductase activating protein
MMLNLANYLIGTRALGPYNRAVVWVQGCCFHCPGCISPEWIETKENRLVPAETVADLILSDATIEGLTISGGEPMLQAAALCDLIDHLKARRDMTIISFTGFRIEKLITHPPSMDVHRLLDKIDVLVDGQYVARLNNGKGLRGSTNQRIHHLTERLSGFDLENQNRSLEYFLHDGSLEMIGIPPRNIENTMELLYASFSETESRK